MKKILTLIAMITPLILWAAPREQDRAILEKGNRELLSNPGFEGGKSTWSATGSSVFSIIKVSPANGNAHGSWDASATGEFFQSGLINVPVKLQGRNKCSVSGEYLWNGVQGDLKLQAYDGTSVIGEWEVEPSATWRAFQPVMVTCPSSTIQWRLESTADAAAILLEDLHLGELGTLDVAQSELVAHAAYETAVGCNWSLTSTSFASFPSDADCNSIVVYASTQTVDTTDDGLPNIVFPELLAGTYEVTVTLSRGRGSDGTNNAVAIREVNSGIIRSRGADQELSSSTSHVVTLNGVFTFTDSAPRTFEIVGAASTGNIQIVNLQGANDSQNRQTTFTVKKYPTQSAEAITLETVGEHWNVNIGGSNPGMSTSNESSWLSIADSGLDLVVNTDSKTAQIPCSVPNNSTGLTCSSGDENIGIVIDIQTAGRYKICGQFSHSLVPTGANANATTAFQWIETPNNAITVTQEGKGRITHQQDIAADGTANAQTIPFNLCGEFIFNSVGQKTIRLMYEQTIAVGAIGSQNIFADRGSAVGDRDIHITVDKMDQQFPTPVFTDLQNSLDSKVELDEPGGPGKLCSVSVNSNCTSSPCSIDNEIGNCVVDVTRLSTGRYDVNFEVGFWSNAPICVANGKDATAGQYAFNTGTNSVTTAAVQSRQTTTAGVQDGRFDLICIGN